VPSGSLRVRSYGEGDVAWAEELVGAELGGRWQVRRGERVDALALPGWVAERDGRRVGLLTGAGRDDGWEVVLIAAAERRTGVGSALVAALVDEAREAGSARVWLVTTNDNLGALAFYQRLGFRLSALRPGAVDAARATLKPEIPAMGEDDLPIRDELELSLPLSTPARVFESGNRSYLRRVQTPPHSTIELVPAAPVPDPDRATVAVPAPGDGPGYWAGGPSAVEVDGVFHLAYRLRRPVGRGRGYAVAIARSDDGEHFETVAVLERAAFDCESLERPTLVRLPDGGWRLYVSCATPGTLHWRVDAVDAPDPTSFDPATARTILPGDERTAYKDTVVHHDGERWHLWVCCHLIEDPTEADRMYTRYATGPDGLSWTSWHGVVLEGRAGAWDARGARLTSVLPTSSGWVAYYDGRALAEQNWEEQTGLATAAVVAGNGSAHFVPLDGPVATSPHGGGGLRYVSAVPLSTGGYRLFYEAAREDGAHDLLTEYVPSAD